MKKLIRILLVIVVAVVVLLGIGLVLLDSLARPATEKGVGYATGVPVTVRAMDVSLLLGRVEMKDMTLANPEGYTAGDFLLRTGLFELGVDVGSLLGDTIRVRDFKLDGIELNIEQKLRGSNISVIAGNLKRLQGPQPEQPPSEGKKLHVGRVVIRNVVARFYLPAELRQEPLVVQVPRIELEDVSSDQPAGVAIGELTRRLLTAVLAAVAQKGQGIVPPDMLAGLDQNVNELVASAGAKAAEMVRQAKDEALRQAGRQATQAVQQAVEEGVKQRLKGVLNRSQ